MEHFRHPASERKKQRNEAKAKSERLWGNFLQRTEAGRPNFLKELFEKSQAVRRRSRYLVG